MGNQIHFAKETPAQPDSKFRHGELSIFSASTPAGHEFVLNQLENEYFSPAAFKPMPLMQLLLMRLWLMEEARQAETKRMSSPCTTVGRRSSIGGWLGVVSCTWRIGFHLASLLAMIMFFFTTAKALAPNPPPGPYHLSCRGASVDGTILKATCIDFFGNSHLTEMANYAACTGDFVDANGHSHARNIFDIDGRLLCVIDLKKRPSSDKNDPGSLFDVISVTESTLRNGGKQTVWRIDRPEVWHNVPNGEVDYPMIAFHPGDRIYLDAGGCVQTGGSGRTWKDYLHPAGSSADEYYSGTIEIPGLNLSPGGFAKFSAVINSPNNPKENQKPHIMPNLPPGSNPNDFPKSILKLGYLDNQLDDNGYYRHDDGNYDQCKGRGPAWVVITVESETKVAGPLFSPHSRPFDLVWDMNSDEDENELPVNPQWNFTLENWHPSRGFAQNPKVGSGEQPHFIPICGAAFNSPAPAEYTFDPNVYARVCSSMSPDFDEKFVGGAICHGHPIPGHLNFGIATYTGPIAWEGFSGTGLLQDSDFSYDLTPPFGAGLAGQDESDLQGTSLHLEFDALEVPLAIMPFWRDLLVPSLPFPTPNSQMFTTFKDGLEGVAIGELGLDGVHGGFSEIHPLFAMAVRVQEGMVPGHPDQWMEKWAFFLRNFGDEGFCSTREWFWPDKPDYFISLPWPETATALIAHPGAVVPWQEAPTPVGIEVNKVQRLSLIRVGRPPGVEQFGVGGSIDLFYKVSGAPKQRRSLAARTLDSRAPAQKPTAMRDDDDQIDIKSLSGRIADSALRTKFETAIKALPPMMEAPRLPKAIPVNLPTTTAERQHVPGAASKGILIHARPVPNSAKQRWAEEMDKVLRAYQKELTIELPTKPSQRLTSTSPQTPPK